MAPTRKKAEDDPVEESILANPRLDRQLPEFGPLLFWRDAPKGGREGIACITTFCPDPHCGCRDAALQALAVDDRLLAVEVTRSGQIRMPCIAEEDPESRPSRGAYCVADLDSGVVTLDKDQPQDEALVAWLKTVVDQEVMDLLRRRWSKMKPGLAAPAQPVRVAPSPRRNDPCPCGSGKKFKHCHLGKPMAVPEAAVVDEPNTRR